MPLACGTLFSAGSQLQCMPSAQHALSTASHVHDGQSVQSAIRNACHHHKMPSEQNAHSAEFHMYSMSGHSLSRRSIAATAVRELPECRRPAICIFSSVQSGTGIDSLDASSCLSAVLCDRGRKENHSLPARITPSSSPAFQTIATQWPLPLRKVIVVNQNLF